MSHIEADDIRFTNWAREDARIGAFLIIGTNASLILVYLVRRVMFFVHSNGLFVFGTVSMSIVVAIAGLLFYR